MPNLSRRLSTIILILLLVSGCFLKPYVTISDAKFGTFSGTEIWKSNFHETSQFSFEINRNYGWVAHIKTNKKTISFAEELTLPTAPDSWGPAEPQSTRKISNQGKTATITRTVKPSGGMIFNSWKIVSGDPKGKHKIRIRIENEEPIEFNFIITNKNNQP